MIRYVVYLPPATLRKPGAGRSTVCSRESFVVAEFLLFEIKGRSPAYTPIMSSRLILGLRTLFASLRMYSTSPTLATGSTLSPV